MSNVYYAPPFTEQLHADTLKEALMIYIDSMGDIPIPDTVTISCYERMVVPSEFLNPLENVLEHLDGEFGGEDTWTHPTDSMKEAEKVFIKAILDEYEPYACEEIDTFQVKLDDWTTLIAECCKCDWVCKEGTVAEVCKVADEHTMSTTYHWVKLNYNWLKDE